MQEFDLQIELFHCATLPPQEGLRRWEELLSAVPLEDFSYRAKRLLPQVAQNLGVEHPIVAEECEKALSHNRMLEIACCQVVTVLEARGIDVIVLKGVVLNRSTHNSLGVRPAHDFDLLVRFEQASQAQQVLLEEGWQPWADWVEPEERLENAMEFKRDGAKLDLHWFLLREARWNGCDVVFWESRSAFHLEGHEMSSLSLTHQLFHLVAVAHREPHHLARYLYDIEIFLRRHHAEIDFEEIERLLTERHLLQRLHNLPLRDLGWSCLRPQHPASLFDRAWSTVTRHRHDLVGEIGFAFFPLFDYWLHYRESEWGLKRYLVRRLELQGFRDFLGRLWRKIWRWGPSS